MNIAVTGGSGFIGSELCFKLLKRNYKVSIFDIVEPTKELDHENLNFFKIDLLDKNEVNQAFKNIDVVFHLAGVVLGGMKKNPQLGIELNIMGTMNVLESCRINSVKKIMVASTFYIYDCIKDLDLVDENTKLNIMDSSYFGASKIMDELITRRFCEQNQIDFNILRFGSVYGAGKASNSVKKFITNTINGVQTEIWGNGDRENQFTHVKDIADGCMLPLEKNLWGNVLNLVSPQLTSTKELSHIIEQKFGGKFVFDKSKKEGTSFVKISSNHTIKILGWDPKPIEFWIDSVYSDIKKQLV
jgi:nucleoside-diphosphate-sugar epimerase